MTDKSLAIFNWSGGKDSSFALWKILQEGNYKISSLLTSINGENNRISMHGVRKDLLEEQARSIGLPLDIIVIPGEVSMEEYDQLMRSKMAALKALGIQTSIFGDIFLEDLRKYREDRSGQFGMKAVFPLWKNDTKTLIREFIDAGFKAVTVCVDANKLDASFVGRMIDEDFVNDLPEGVDPCGENGEYHSFVFDGPIFSKPIPFVKGEKIRKDFSHENPEWNNSFWYCDLK